MAKNVSKTAKMYGFLWSKDKALLPLDTTHFDLMQKAVGEPIVRGSIGIDVGSGSGYDTYSMARNYPFTKIVSMDISDGVYKTKRLTGSLTNVRIIKCSALDIPFVSDIFDFAYSFGVLHHTPAPERGLSEIARVLKKDSPVFLYLYEDHSENFLKYSALKIINKIRIITVKIPVRILYTLSFIIAPFIFIIFTLPARFLKSFKATQRFAEKIPFNFAASFFSLRYDLYDRFGAPIEHRFSKQGVYDLFAGCGFYKINITRLKGIAGWVAWGYKR